MPTNDYLPQEDALFRTYAESFVSGITANPALYMMTGAQAASVQAAVQDFVEKMAIAEEPSTRTSQTIADRKNARSVAEGLIRRYAMLIKENTGISDGDKLAIGVRPINVSREPIECPQSMPVINIVGNTPGAQTLRFVDSVTQKKQKPFGASEVQLFVAIGPAPATDPTTAKFVGKFTKNPIAVPFSAGQGGLYATYFARWASVRGETGPFGVPASMRIAA